MFKPKNILVPTDFSDAAEKALSQAVDLARTYHAALTLLHVIEPERTLYEEEFNAPTRQASMPDSEQMEQSWERMQDEVFKIPGTRAMEIHFDVKKGMSADEILREEAEKDFDLIVMPDHGRSPATPMVLGHVSDTVLSRSRIPVLLVRS